MAKKIIFPYRGKEYTLAFTRATVKQMEQMGFQLSDRVAKPVTFVETLFAGAFLAYHKHVAGDQKLLDEIYGKFTDRERLINALTEMYVEPALTLLDENGAEDDEGNIAWGEAD